MVPTTSSEAAQARSKQGRAGQQSVGRRTPTRSRSARGPALVAALIVAVLVGAVGAMAYWTAPGAGSGAAKAGHLNPPTGVTVPRTTPLGPCRSADGIGGRRRWGDSGGLLRRAERRRSKLVARLRFGLDDESDHHRFSCDDTGLSSGTYTYRVWAVFQTDHLSSDPSGSVTVAISVTTLHRMCM